MIEDTLAEIDRRDWFLYGVSGSPNGCRVMLARRSMGEDMNAYTPYVPGDTLADALDNALALVPAPAAAEGLLA